MILQDLFCMHCGYKFEELVKDGVLPDCPECNSDTLAIDLAVPNFQLKGSGWSQDGYVSGLYNAPKDRAEQDRETKKEYENQFRKD